MKRTDKFIAWEGAGFQIRNYGGPGYNVYFDGLEIDCFTYYGTSPDTVISDYLSRRVNKRNNLNK